MAETCGYVYHFPGDPDHDSALYRCSKAPGHQDVHHAQTANSCLTHMIPPRTWLMSDQALWDYALFINGFS